MRCKHCGGVLESILTDLPGQRIFHCTQQSTEVSIDLHSPEQLEVSSRMNMCDKYYNQEGQELHKGDSFAYADGDGHVKYFRVP
uniref:Uncharacterized protein n=1 Tax=viral metagenome TaxID=1070528 RepID=A0A6M3LW30_9ZZZZ